jgi:hypothetical protein
MAKSIPNGLEDVELDDPEGELHVSNVAMEGDRTVINSFQDRDYRSNWQRTSAGANVYFRKIEGC